MKKVYVIFFLSLFSGIGYGQVATVGSPNFDVQGPFYHRQNLHVLNNTSTGWVVWGTRDTSTPQSTISFSNINNAFFQGNVGIGTNAPSAKLHVVNSSISQTSTAKTDANFIIQATSTTRSTTEGAALGFVVPANTDGSNHWQQGRILVTPDNTSGSNASGRMYLQTRYTNAGVWKWKNNLVLLSSGNVGIGTEAPSHKLDVNGTIHAREVLVDLNFPGPDYVFEEDYPLSSLSEIESYIKTNKHLPEVPSAAQMKEEGVNVIEMQMLLLKKVEELTLLLIDQGNMVIELKKENQQQSELINQLQKTN
uniref:hypothetical protein n=1 Tax=Fulvivirga sp. TaxID=1931237 RepID=UPI00404B282F